MIAIALARAEFVLLALLYLGGVVIGWNLRGWHQRTRAPHGPAKVIELHPFRRVR